MAAENSKSYNSRSVYIPSFLTNQELIQLILEAPDGFLFIVNCHYGRITFISESIVSILNCNKKEWLGASIYDKIHVDDIENVKLQLSIKLPIKPLWSSDIRSGNWKNEDIPVTDCLKRDFICRMKTGNLDIKHRKRDNYFRNRENPNYLIVRCNGFIKKELPYNQFYYTTSVYSPKDDATSAYLVVTGRLEIYSIPYSISTLNMKMEFTTRININGVFIFVDDQIRQILSYLPKDLLGRNFQNFCHPLDRPLMYECFKQSLNFKGQHMTVLCRFKSKKNEWVSTRATMYGFVNQWSSVDEFIVCTYSKVNLFIENPNEFYYPVIVQDNQISSTYGQSNFSQAPPLDYNVQIQEYEAVSKLYENLQTQPFSNNESAFPKPSYSPDGSYLLENPACTNTSSGSDSLNQIVPTNNGWPWHNPVDEFQLKEELKMLDSPKSYIFKNEIENYSQELTDILSVLSAENSSVFENVFNDTSNTINDKDLDDFQGASNVVEEKLEPQ